MNEKIKATIDTIKNGIRFPDYRQWEDLLLRSGPEETQYLLQQADEVRRQVFGDKVYIRGLIEFTSYCRRDCYYCGLRKSHSDISRYRLNPDEILKCCALGYEAGIRTFVLQGGEDPYWNDDRLTSLISSIHDSFPDCAITLSVGERSRESYQRLYDAGADRYLLRHETADWNHYEHLHPEEMAFSDRRQCLMDLKSIGYQVGCGFMVGSPGQTIKHVIKDLKFICEFNPHMVGVGPFIPAAGTPFENEPAGSAKLTLKLLSILRLLNPNLLLPATTALGTASQDGRIRGIEAGANVIMPNLSPSRVRSQFCIYDNKACTGLESVEGLDQLREDLDKVGYRIVTDRGDYPVNEKLNYSIIVDFENEDEEEEDLYDSYEEGEPYDFYDPYNDRDPYNN